MGEKESAAAMPGTGAEKGVQWEPHKAPGLDSPEQERSAGEARGATEGEAAARSRHDSSMSAIQNTR